MIELIGAALTGGVLTQVLNYLLSSRKEQANTLQAIIATWKEDNERLRKLEEESRRRIIELESHVLDLQSKILLLESTSQDLPFPMWLKDLNGNMLAVNSIYEENLLLPLNKSKKDYIGKPDSEIWSKEIVDKFSLSDKKIRINKTVNQFDLSFPDINNNLTHYRVITYPKFVGKTLIGIAGIAIEKDKLN